MLRWASLHFRLFTVALLVAHPSTHAATIIGGDSIGPDSSLTDFLGGFAAVQDVSGNLGQPAVKITQDGQSLLDSMRVIILGTESTSGVLDFSAFQYRLKIWTTTDYLNGLTPGIDADLSGPTNVTLVQPDAMHIVPDTVFGEASFDPGSFSRPSYDFQFDLSLATLVGGGTPAFSTPLPAGDYIVAIQSHHNAADGGFNVSLSSATQGLIPYFHQEFGGNEQHVRGVLLGQDPNSLSFRWGWNIFETPAYADFDSDGDVDGFDFLKWQRGESFTPLSSEDLALWESEYGMTGLPTPLQAAVAVPEPSGLILLSLATLGLWNHRGRRGTRRTVERFR